MDITLGSNLSQVTSPSIDNPVNVNVIKGNNTIKISNEKNTEFQLYNINLGSIEYGKIGDFNDIIFKNTTDNPNYNEDLIENEWYIIKKIDSVTLNGTENWQYPTNDDDYTFYQLNNSYFNTKFGKRFKQYSNSTGIMYSDRFINISGQNASMLSATGIGNYNQFLRISLPNTIVSTLNGFKEWLSNNNVKMYFILETPENIHISEEDYSELYNQLEDLYNKAKSYKNKTIITQTNQDLPFVITYKFRERGLKDSLYDINEFLKYNL